jgi:hypothetical protein
MIAEKMICCLLTAGHWTLPPRLLELQTAEVHLAGAALFEERALSAPAPTERRMDALRSHLHLLSVLWMMALAKV